MALRYSHEYAAVPIIMINHSEAPNVGLGQLPGWLVNYEKLITAQIINKAGEKAHTNAARMYCFNSLVDNGYNNDFFRLVAGLAIKLMDKAKNQFPNGDDFNIIKESVNTALQYVTSALPHEEPELKAYVGPKFMNDSYKYLELYKQLREESMINLGAQSNQLQVGVGVNNIGGQAYIEVQANNGFSNRFKVENRGNGPFIVIRNQAFPIGDENGTIITVVNNNKVSVADLFYQLILNETQQQMANNQAFLGNAFVNNNTGQVFNNNNNQGNSVSMFGGNSLGNALNGNGNNQNQNSSGDRYSGGMYDKHLQRTPTNQTVNDIISQRGMAEPAPQAIQQPKQQQPKIREKTMTASTSFANTVSSQMFGEFSSAMKTAKPDDYGVTRTLSSLQYLTDDVLIKNIGSGRISRTFATILKHRPVTSARVRDYSDRILSAQNLPGLASAISSLIKAVNDVGRRAVGDQQQETRSIMAALVSVNNDLTAMFNDLLRDRLGKDASITNFSEDVVEALNALPQVLSPEELEILNDFEADLIGSMSQVNNEILDAMTEELADHKGMQSLYIPVDVSITYIDGLSIDLGFEIKSGNIVVDKSVAPLFCNMLDTLVRSKALVGNTMYDYVLTSDAVLFSVWKNAEGKWVMKKV